MTEKVMKLLNPVTGLMKCKVCGARHFANIRPASGGKFYRGSWQCQNGCRLGIAIEKDECDKQLVCKIAKEELEVD